MAGEKQLENDEIWTEMREEVLREMQIEPMLTDYLYRTILESSSLDHSLAIHLSNKLSTNSLSSTQLYNIFLGVFESDYHIQEAFRADFKAVRQRDPACLSYLQCMLHFKGFQACQGYRVSHKLWNEGRTPLALAFQSRISEVFNVDIHPAAKIGKGILFDHATGIVIGETTSIGDNVTILHHVTLGGTGKEVGDRHPKVGNGVLIGAGATILGNIIIGDGEKIGAGAVVFFHVPPFTTAVGNPARLLGGRKNPTLHTDTPSETMDHTSFYTEWSGYVI